MCKRIAPATDAAMAAKLARVAARKAAAPPVDLLGELDKRIRSVDTGRRADCLVSLPAMLATIAPLLWLSAPGIALVVNVILAVPVLLKIIRCW